MIRVLEELEDERIRELEFIELNACAGGCVGGVACVENAYVAKARLQRLRRYLPVSKNHLAWEEVPLLRWETGLEFAPVLKLSDDMGEALRMMGEIDRITEKFPGLDCGSCGAPSCRALAEDVVRGDAKESDCIFVLREEIRTMGQHVGIYRAALCRETCIKRKRKKIPAADEKGRNHFRKDYWIARMIAEKKTFAL